MSWTVTATELQNQKLAPPAQEPRTYSFYPWLLLAILGAGLALRLVGITYGLPEIYTSLEQTVIAEALKMAKEGTLIPHDYGYPPFVKYLYMGLFGAWYSLLRVMHVVASPEGFERLYFLNPSGFFLISRMLNVILGTLTIWWTYRIGLSVYGSFTGLLASALVATNAIHVIDSHFGLTDVPMAALATLTLLLLLRASKSRGQGARLWIAAGAAMALSVSFKQNAIVLLLPFVAAAVIVWRLGPRAPGEGKKIPMGPLVGLGAFALLLVVLNVGAILDGGRFIQTQYERYILGGYVSFKYPSTISGWRFYLDTALWKGFGPVGVILGGVGILVAFVRRSQADIILLALIIPYTILICSSVIQQSRYLNLLIPLLALLSGRALSELWVGLRTKGKPSQVVVVGGLILGLLGWPLSIALAVDYRLTQPDTRTLAKDWLMEHVGPEERVLMLASRQSYVPFINPSREAAISQMRFQPSGRLRWLSGLSDSDYPTQSRHVLYVTRTEEYNLVEDENFPIVVTGAILDQDSFFRFMHPDMVHYIRSDEFFRYDGRIQKLLSTRYKVVASFVPDRSHLGPRITIYQRHPEGSQQ